jgi:hypothetical protein
MRSLKILCAIFLIFVSLAGAGLLVLQDTNVHIWLDRFDASRIDARIAEARKKSDAAALEVLLEMLREKTFSRERAISRIQSLQFPPEIALAASPELVTILEENAGPIVMMASQELQRIGPLVPDDLVPRLVELTKHGEPEWRRAQAFFVLKAKWHGKDVDDPTVRKTIQDVEQSDWFRNYYRSGIEHHSGHAEHGFGSSSSHSIPTSSEATGTQTNANSGVERIAITVNELLPSDMPAAEKPLPFSTDLLQGLWLLQSGSDAAVLEFLAKNSDLITHESQIPPDGVIRFNARWRQWSHGSGWNVAFHNEECEFFSGGFHNGQHAPFQGKVGTGRLVAEPLLDVDVVYPSRFQEWTIRARFIHESHFLPEVSRFAGFVIRLSCPDRRMSRTLEDLVLSGPGGEELRRALYGDKKNPAHPLVIVCWGGRRKEYFNLESPSRFTHGVMNDDWVTAISKWIADHRQELLENWKRAQRGYNLIPVQPPENIRSLSRQH